MRSLQFSRLVVADCPGTDLLPQDFGPEGWTPVVCMRIDPACWGCAVLIGVVPIVVGSKGVIEVHLLTRSSEAAMLDFAARLRARLGDYRLSFVTVRTYHLEHVRIRPEVVPCEA